jgi:uncharacterized protein (TIGR03086 family)
MEDPDPAEAHRRALAGFGAVVGGVPDERWGDPTPCDDWDAGALVEHVIGFHEFLLLRPLGVRAHRPRTGPAARWFATEHAILELLEDRATLDHEAEFFDGARRRPIVVLPALASDTLVHTWDLARAAGLDPALDPELCQLAFLDALSARDSRADSGLFALEVPVEADAPTQDRLVGLLGRDPAWPRLRPR